MTESVTSAQVEEMLSCIGEALTLSDLLTAADKDMDYAQIQDIGGLLHRLVSGPLELGTDLLHEKWRAEGKIS